MTLEELNSYRLTSLDEPSDEMLSQIMKEAAAEAKQKREIAYKRYMDDLQRKVDALSL